jgi:hypothetical protein
VQCITIDEQKCHIDAVGDNVIQELPHGSPPQGLFGSGCLILASPCEFSALDREKLSSV